MNKFDLVDDLRKFLKENYDAEEKIKETKSGKKTIFFRKSGKSLCIIEFNEEKIAVVVVIGISLNDKVLSSNISQKTKKMFEEAKQFFDGKWLYFEINTEKDLEDIKTLILIKKTPKKK